MNNSSSYDRTNNIRFQDLYPFYSVKVKMRALGDQVYESICFYDGLGNKLQTKVKIDEEYHLLSGRVDRDAMGRVVRNYEAVKWPNNCTLENYNDDVSFGDARFTLCRLVEQGPYDGFEYYLAQDVGVYHSGQIEQVESDLPEFEGFKTLRYNSYLYDDYGREIRKRRIEEDSGGSWLRYMISHVNYDGLYENESFDWYAGDYNKMRSKLTRLDKLGRVSEIIEKGGENGYSSLSEISKINYHYDSRGNLLSAIIANNESTSNYIEYDELGQKRT